MGVIKILFLADTHLGFDLPMKPRIKRRRRGYDFFANYEKALIPALNGEVDCVIHGGDIFFRSRVPARIVEMAFEPLKRIADMDIPVYVVPGNHERSVIPHRKFADHPLIFIFDEPTTFFLETSKGSLALSGFPCVRINIRNTFKDILAQTAWEDIKADARVLCLHQAFAGSTVGPQNYTFRYSHDVVRMRDIPGEFLAVFAGHIHRAQLLQHDLLGNSITTPVFYPGSIDRTSFAERREAKGYLTIEIESGSPNGATLKKWNFHELETRPMFKKEITAANFTAENLISRIKTYLNTIPAHSIVDFRVTGLIPEDLFPVLSAPALRKLAPSSMNVTATLVEYRGKFR